ncbi:MAG: cell envelope integrity protein TolA [Solidesulfovibrio sp.]
MDVSRSHFTLNTGLLVSVAVHALPFVLVFVLTHSKSVVPLQKNVVLQVELLGMVTGQQVSGQEEVAAVKEQPQELHQEEAPPPEPSRPVEPNSVPKPVLPHQRRSSAPAPPKQASEGQVQQTISKRDLEASLLRQYFTELTRIVIKRLIYPVKAKAKLWSGVTLVAFTVTEGGSIVPGSESVSRSSGYDELDQAALNAVRSAGLLPKPPHQMQVVVDVDFTKTVQN